MQTRSAFALAAAAILSVAIAAAVSVKGAGPALDPLVGKPVLPKLAEHPDAVAKIAIKRGAIAFSLVKSGNQWTMPEKSGYRADPAKVRQLLLGLVQTRYVEPKTNRPELYARLNLDDPAKDKSQATLVEVFDDKGASLGTAILGKRRIDELGGGSDGIYVRLPNEARSWLARGTLDLDGEAVQWLDRRIVDLDDKRMKLVVLRHADGTQLTIFRDKPEDKLSLKELPPDRKLKSDVTLVEPASVLQALDLTDVKSAREIAVPADGIDSAAFTNFDGLTVKVELFKQGEQDWIRLTASAEGDDKVKADAQALTQRWEGWVYGIASYKAGALRSKLADLLAPAEQPAAKPAGSK